MVIKAVEFSSMMDSVVKLIFILLTQKKSSEDWTLETDVSHKSAKIKVSLESEGEMLDESCLDLLLGEDKAIWTSGL